MAGVTQPQIKAHVLRLVGELKDEPPKRPKKGIQAQTLKELDKDSLDIVMIIISINIDKGYPFKQPHS